MDGVGTPGEPDPPAVAEEVHEVGPTSPLPAPEAPPRLRGGEAVKAHLTLAAGLTVCVVAFWFEVSRALGGNGLSWAYVFEWPLFAVFAVYMWWTVLHGGRGRHRRRPPKPAPVVDPKYAGMLEAWQEHQEVLRAAQADADSRIADVTTQGGDDGIGRP